MDHLCLILLKSDQKFLTRFYSVSFWLTRQLVEEPGFKNVKNKHLGMSPFLAEFSLVLSFST